MLEIDKIYFGKPEQEPAFQTDLNVNVMWERVAQPKRTKTIDLIKDQKKDCFFFRFLLFALFWLNRLLSIIGINICDDVFHFSFVSSPYPWAAKKLKSSIYYFNNIEWAMRIKGEHSIWTVSNVVQWTHRRGHLIDVMWTMWRYSLSWEHGNVPRIIADCD